MSLRDDVLVRPGAIDAADLVLLAEYLREAPMADSLVSNFEDPDGGEHVEWILNQNIRDTQEVQLSVEVVERLEAIHRRNIASHIDPFYAITIRDSEPLQILHYGVGGHYIPHVDAETLYTDESDLKMWEKTLDRDVSVVYFLNDDFEGGELIFPDLGLSIEPQAGTLVCFPSDHHFIHGVKPVTRGHRYTLVTWMRVEGMPTPEEINQAALDEYHRHFPRQIQQLPRVTKGGGGMKLR